MKSKLSTMKYNDTWKAMCELGDYFSKMGGAARPRNMAESEIPLYVACKLIELHDISFNSNEYLDRAFLKAAVPVLEKTDSYLLKISLSFAELMSFVLEFYIHFDKKLKANDKTTRWKVFGKYIEEINS